ncbi:phosphatidylinositol glycan [Cavenderia fasciculata]|uniref:Phosphatidylinositol glycan n=1 Tax=Cavenderia fasciculata TaxID=261658 RepID=F4Q545_CACFS|nr:phosphatidylinositol glycan [Cavenderia fasciculata]EGG17938.1 phosphatidylinositol glycan [Cavenderia fasciculata]|eukprot:XP_004356422.1 phosphatidylinositol glycan [Cavenderia fasciculata]
MAVSKRVTIVAVFVVSFLLGLPVWWYTTTTYRSPVEFEPILKYNQYRQELQQLKVTNNSNSNNNNNNSIVGQWPSFIDLINRYHQPNHDNVVKTATEYCLSFTLLNADPSSIIPKWQFQELYNANLKQFVDQISVIANFTIQSKVSHYATLLKSPIYDKESNSYYIPSGSLSEYINPNEWQLDSTSTNQPTLNFIVYIPPPSQSPLYIGKPGSPSSSKSNAFSIPQYGGVVIHNVNHQSAADATSTVTGSSSTTTDLTNELQEAILTFRYQLQDLFGISRKKEQSQQQNNNNKSTITKNQLNKLILRSLADNVNVTIDTLTSLSSLLDSLPNMLVLDNIKEKVDLAIERINATHTAFAKGDFYAALAASKVAFNAAEEAFFDENMLSQLYFPDEHKYAVYTPLFVPVCFPIIAGVFQEFKHYRLKKSQKKTK